MTDHELSIKRQCELLSLRHSSYYYQAKSTSNEEIELLRLLDEQFLKTPCYGSRKMTVFLRESGYSVNRKRVQRLMRKLGIEALYPKPRLSQRNLEHKVYPYLLCNLSIEMSNQVWCTDITYLPVLKGYFYLVAIMDWYSRKVLSWRISNTLDVHFCIESLQEAFCNFGCPQIFNSDQGSQFTSNAFTQCLKDRGIKISMDGRGRYLDNIFIERLWRSLKYELIYIKAFEDGKHLQKEVKDWFHWYNTERPHQALDYQKPDQVYTKSLMIPQVT